jgi:hypothetical protein
MSKQVLKQIQTIVVGASFLSLNAMVDKHVEAFETGDGRILDTDCEYVTT